MVRTGVAARPDFDERTETVFSWIQDHTRSILIGGAILGVLAAGAWVYRYSSSSRETKAAQNLSLAEASIGRNPALAEKDLEQLVSQYGGTTAGRQAALLLAELLYDKGQYQQGIDKLKPVTSSDDAAVAAVALAQTAAGYEELHKYTEAADAYQKAADRARFAADRSAYLASAARAHTLAGKPEQAKRIWTQLADDPTNASAGEARVRLGELQTQPAKPTP